MGESAALLKGRPGTGGNAISAPGVEQPARDPEISRRSSDPRPPPPSRIVRAKLLHALLLVPGILVIDWVTKRWALTALDGGRQIETLGGLVPLTLAFNRGAAFGMGIGDDSRWLFVPVTFVALGLLGVLFKQAEEGDHLRLVAIASVTGGALGNLWDRVRWSRGVVDFIGPVDLGFWDFPIFNAADIAITCGAILLALSFWQEERRLAESGRLAEAGAETAGGGPAQATPPDDVPDAAR